MNRNELKQVYKEIFEHICSRKLYTINEFVQVSYEYYGQVLVNI